MKEHDLSGTDCGEHLTKIDSKSPGAQYAIKKLSEDV